MLLFPFQNKQPLILARGVFDKEALGIIHHSLGKQSPCLCIYSFYKLREKSLFKTCQFKTGSLRESSGCSVQITVRFWIFWAPREKTKRSVWSVFFFFLMSVTVGWCRAQWVQVGHGASWGNKSCSWYWPLSSEVSKSLFGMSWERISAKSLCHCLCTMRIPSWLLLERILGSNASSLILMELLAENIFFFYFFW